MKTDVFVEDSDDPVKIYLRLMSKLKRIVLEAEIELEAYKKKR